MAKPKIDYSSWSDADLEAYTKKDYAKMSDTALAAVAGRAPARATDEPQDLSGQTPASAGMGSTGGGAASGQTARGGMRRRSSDMVPEEGSVPMEQWLKNSGRAAVNAVPAAYRGVKQLVGGDVSEEDIKNDRAIADAPGGMAGNIVGNLALGGPAMSATRAAILKGATYLPKVLQSAAKVSASYPVLAGIEGATTTPVIGDESRLENGLISAGTTAVLQGAGTVLKRALTQPVKPNADAEYLMATKRALPQTEAEIAAGKPPVIVDKDKIVPTQSQGGTGIMGGITNALENITSYLPLGIGSATKRGRDRVAGEVMDEVGHRASPISAIDVLPGRGEFIREHNQQIQDAYKAMFAGKNLKYSSSAFNKSSIDEGLKRLTGAMGEDEFKDAFTKTMGKILPKNRTSLTGEEWHTLQSRIREEIRGAEGELFQKQSHHALANAYRAVEENLAKLRDMHFTPQEVGTLKDIDNKYLKGLVVKEGLGEASENGTPAIALKNLVHSVEKNTPDNIKLDLKGEFQDLTEPAKRILLKSTDPDALARRGGYVASSNILGTAAGAGAMTGVGALPVIGTVGAGHGTARFLTGRNSNRYMFGDFEWQKKVAEALRKFGVVGDPASAAIGGSTGQRGHEYE